MAESKGFEYWIARLNSQHWVDRALACESLGQARDLRAVVPLIERLKDQASGVRQATCEALGEVGDMRAVEPLAERLWDEYSDVRRAARQALVRLGKGLLAHAVVGAIGGEVEAHQKVGRVPEEGDLRAVVPLIEMLGYPVVDVRKAASEALKSITEALDPYHLFCRSCLVSFQQKAYRVRRVGTVSVPVCRLCGRADKAMTDVRQLVAVLDTEMGEELSCVDGVARVSYLKRDAPFDFDWVEIVRAGDYEVERFCVQLGNDADPYRKGRYRKMRCLVAPGCLLSENTLRILRSMFGRVEVATGQEEHP
jgi:hypothetical protein